MSTPHYVAGIDFGTTNSAVSVTDGGAPRLVRISPNADTIPTALFFDDNDRQVYIGLDAYNKYCEPFSSGRFMRSLKRILGTPAMLTGTEIHGRHVRFADIIGYFVRHLKDKLDEDVGAPVTDVILGRPVHFRDNDASGDIAAQNQLAEIARKCGFCNIGFQYEPIAAAFSHEALLTNECLALVIDIGGGTSDFTVIRLGPDLMHRQDRTDDILANSGIRIGGNDFDYAFALDKFMPLYGLGSTYRSGDKVLPVPNAPYIDLATWSSVNRVYTPRIWNMMRTVQIGATEPDKIARLMDVLQNNHGHINLDYIEQAKISLSTSDRISQKFNFLADGPTVVTSVDELISAISQDVDKIHESMYQCLSLAGVYASDIELVILTGGSTQIPYILSTVRNLFPHAIISDTNKMASVGQGLAYDAIRRFL